MTIMDGLLALGPASFFLLLALEARHPARELPRAPGFRWLGVLGLLVMLAIGTYFTLLVPERWVAQYRVFDLSSLNPGLAGAIAWLTYTLLGYVWHRAVHASSWLWRGVHQLHHAPRRLDVASSTIFHPTETVGYTALALFTSVFLLGLAPMPAACIGSLAAFVSFFQHANLKTPPWLGYFIQRPEAHSLHHHVAGPRGNYSDLPLWDILFGTFENPSTFNSQVGFPAHASRRWLAMLAFVDVHPAKTKMLP
jgi:sterol desaturase/sphingolipid hydroxylase (fatty acid hydroxylase superfamily)